MSVRVRTYVRPSVLVRACKSEVIYRRALFFLFSPAPSAVCPRLSPSFPRRRRFASSSSRARRRRLSLSRRARSTGQERRRATLFFLFLFRAQPLLRAFESPSGGGARTSGTFFSFRAVYARECVAGVNQSTSPGIRLYGTPGAWMTSRGSRDGAMREDDASRAPFHFSKTYFAPNTADNAFFSVASSEAP